MPSSSQPTPVVAPEISVAEAHREDAYSQEVRDARRAGGRWRKLSRWLGLLCFVAGIGLLVYVFLNVVSGLQRLAQPGVLNAAFLANGGQSKEIAVVVQAVVAVFGAEFLRVLYLFILGYLASAIAARGIQFFAASEAVIDEAVVADA